LFCDPDTAARRVFKDLKKNARSRNEGSLPTVTDVKRDLIKRMATDRKRYRQYYQKNVFNPKHYDFALDTSRLNRRQVFLKVYAFCRKKIEETE
jgi:cytidylate kinase